MSDFDAIDPRRAICYLPMNGQYRQDVGPNLLADGDMEAVGVGSYVFGNNGVGSKDNTTPYTGSQCLRVDGAGPSSYPYAAQDITVTGAQYHFRGWGAGDGVNIKPRLANTFEFWSGTPSTTWQECDVIYTATGARVYLMGNGPTPGFFR
jgi:hypothetical protein